MTLRKTFHGPISKHFCLFKHPDQSQYRNIGVIFSIIFSISLEASGTEFTHFMFKGKKVSGSTKKNRSKNKKKAQKKKKKRGRFKNFVQPLFLNLFIFICNIQYYILYYVFKFFRVQSIFKNMNKYLQK